MATTTLCSFPVTVWQPQLLQIDAADERKMVCEAQKLTARARRDAELDDVTGKTESYKM